MAKAPDNTCSSCHFRVLGCSGHVCGYAGARVKIEDPKSGTCSAWRRYFDAYQYRENKRELVASLAD